MPVYDCLEHLLAMVGPVVKEELVRKLDIKKTIELGMWVGGWLGGGCYMCD